MDWHHCACVAHLGEMSRGVWNLGDIDKTNTNKIFKILKNETFDHLSGRNGIESTLHVTGCIIEHKETLGKAIYPALEDVNCTVDLGNKFFHVKEPIPMFPWFENNAGLSAEKSI